MTDKTNFCMGCMADMAGNTVCPQCGWNSQEPQMLHALPYGASLQGRYIVGRAQKTNGEGITYIGRDTVQNTLVEIREFFPQSLCSRSEDGASVQIAGGNEIVFQEALTLFLNYAREIAHLRELSAIVPVFDIFEENHTAYTISEWNESITLQYFVERSGGHLTWNAARQLFMPVLSALSTMHAAGVMHLGISPQSLKIMQDGKMRLGDFSVSLVRRMDTDLPPDMVPGCAALEQYTMGMQLTEATDVYGFTASLLFALTGELPKDAVYRKEDSRLMIPTDLAKTLPPHVITAVANGLQVQPESRTQTFERLRVELSAAPTVTSHLEQQTTSITKLPPLPEKKKDEGMPGIVWMLVSCAISLLVMSVIVWVWFQFQPDTLFHPSDEVSSVSGEMSESDTSSSLEFTEDTGSDMIPAPDLRGQKYTELLEKVSAAESPEYTILLSDRAFDNTVEEGCVISQQPEAGTEMRRGDSIVVVISQGEPTRQLPDVENLTLAQAAELVTDEGFIPVTERVANSEVGADMVIGYKDHEAGDTLAYGSEVVLLISTGSADMSEESAEESSR